MQEIGDEKDDTNGIDPCAAMPPVPASYHASDLKSWKRSHNCSNDSEAAVIFRCAVGVITLLVICSRASVGSDRINHLAHLHRLAVGSLICLVLAVDATLKSCAYPWPTIWP